MVQQFYLIYCVPVHIYELVSHWTRQATVDFVSMYNLGQFYPPYCLDVTTQDRPEQGENKWDKGKYEEGAEAMANVKYDWEKMGEMKLSGTREG